LHFFICVFHYAQHRKLICIKNKIKKSIIIIFRLGNLDRVREILTEDITQRDVLSQPEGATPLMYAAMAGRLDIAQLLVESGCDVNKQDTDSGFTALLQAVMTQ